MELTAEQRDFQLSVRRLAREVVAPRAVALDEDDEFPWDLARAFAQVGLVQLMVPEAYGGPGGDVVSICLAREEIARVSAAASLLVSNNTIGGVLPLLHVGSDELRRRYLPALAGGERLCAVCITEPEAGSDVAAMQTRAVRDGETYVVNGRKCFITFGDVADYVTLFARTGAADYGTDGISAFFVETKSPGFAVTRHERKMGIRGSTNVELVFENLRVRAEQRLGDEGAGFALAMHLLERNRPTVGAIAVGLAQGALDFATDYAKGRIQFRRPIARLQAIQFMLADMKIQIEAARALVYKAARLLDGDDPEAAVFSAMSKCFASDVAMDVTTDAVQVLGGYGYMKDYPVERMMRDAKILQIFEGTNQIQRVVIARALLDAR